MARFSEDVLPLSDLKARASQIVEQVRQRQRPLLLTRRGRGVAVLLGLDEYETLVDRAAFAGAVREGAEAVARGDFHEHEDAVRLLDDFGTPSDEPGAD